MIAVMIVVVQDANGYTKVQNTGKGIKTMFVEWLYNTI